MRARDVSGSRGRAVVDRQVHERRVIEVVDDVLQQADRLLQHVRRFSPHLHGSRHLRSLRHGLEAIRSRRHRVVTGSDRRQMVPAGRSLLQTFAIHMFVARASS